MSNITPEQKKIFQENYKRWNQSPVRTMNISFIKLIDDWFQKVKEEIEGEKKK